MARLVYELHNFDCSMCHRPGASLKNVDVVSPPLVQASTDPFEKVTISKIWERTECLPQGTDGRFQISSPVVLEVLEIYNTIPDLGSHDDLSRTYVRLTKHFT